MYQARGLSAATAKQVAKELSAGDAFKAHLDVEHGLDPDDLTNPIHAAWASAIAFLSGAAIPLIAAIIPTASFRIPVIFGAVILALIVTGGVSAHVGGANKTKATIRVVLGGAIAMIVTYGIGRVIGVSV
jgi:VIT1/CCC1 family predicted Fe2+/Mn2+ transporter